MESHINDKMAKGTPKTGLHLLPHGYRPMQRTWVLTADEKDSTEVTYAQARKNKMFLLDVPQKEKTLI